MVFLQFFAYLPANKYYRQVTFANIFPEADGKRRPYMFVMDRAESSDDEDE